jgi:hypothetical protein
MQTEDDEVNNMTRFLLLILLILTSCTSEQQNIYQPSSNQPTPANSTPTTSVHDYVSDSDYKRECLDINPSIDHKQADFLGMYTGLTRSQSVRETFGDPDKIFTGGSETEWLYDNAAGNIFSVIIVDDTVDYITVGNLDNKLPSLREIVEKYGCPGLIEAVDTSEEPTGKYGKLLFSYPDIGIEYWFEGIKVRLADVPSETNYFVPIPLFAYIQSYSKTLYINSPTSELVVWHDVVVDK